ncbi:WS/DGAT/MGAT family O-acyltransferase [Alkanindiges illinoisensis]|uniref:diacylglycerol O-acyltransferase n=1 Tax=Alkanindiges illinoisensis TaxID=197183 RepID=A0A4Y7XFX4_9GAMM|nr:wax ester/triacylglycerol synthase family O-acyltransferase [Alkanindiges illinoisensis]TEU30412.1 wax ester/triacylglycerol synthase family O-acyltransferase [Alkanindiges illinoisensis]
MRPLSPIDFIFLSLEKRQQPMHVGGLFLFKLPENAPADFVHQLVEDIRNSRAVPVAPFNQVLNGIFWGEDEEFDLDQHFRHISLPRPGRIRELLIYVSQEHSALIDRAKPLWECHIIEGIEGNRFAMFFKMHHAMVDGVAGMRLLEKSLSHSPTENSIVPPWAVKNNKLKRPTANPLSKTAKLVRVLTEQIQTVPNLSRELINTVFKEMGKNPDYVSTFQAPQCIINQPISASRRFAAQSYDLARFRNVAKKLGVTINDVVLAVCSGALRSYLIAQRALPKKPLIAMVPISLRTDDSHSGNQISMILANLGTHKGDPLERLEIIKRSVLNAKNRFGRMKPSEILSYSGLVYSTAGLNLLSGALPRHQAFNLVISNVPGPREPLYWNGAQLDALYPASVLMDGQALNITLTSYMDKLEVGITACRHVLPRVQSLLALLEEEIQTFEHLTRFMEHPASINV